MRNRHAELGDRNIIGERVTQRRLSIGMRQKELFNRIREQGVDIDTSGVSKIEGQTRVVTDKEILVISRALDVSVSYLLTGKEGA